MTHRRALTQCRPISHHVTLMDIFRSRIHHLLQSVLQRAGHQLFYPIPGLRITRGIRTQCTRARDPTPFTPFPLRLTWSLGLLPLIPATQTGTVRGLRCRCPLLAAVIIPPIFTVIRLLPVVLDRLILSVFQPHRLLPSPVDTTDPATITIHQPVSATVSLVLLIHWTCSLNFNDGIVLFRPLRMNFWNHSVACHTTNQFCIKQLYNPKPSPVQYSNSEPAVF